MLAIFKKLEHVFTGRQFADLDPPSVTMEVKSKIVQQFPLKQELEFFTKIGVTMIYNTDGQFDQAEFMVRRVLADELYGDVRSLAIQCDRALFNRDFQQASCILNKIIKLTSGDTVE